ncbi:type II toxin-antitoxin system HipA family toxin [Protaetiibacter intestinalis]|uniref:Type II toxin-antitoxin system HipA family toxin n=1 Tax=Protaetiibacter intestinalis TaxID=2419774 RepID=A0A387BC55_9MICO|nr:HipA domain-containing protein [Protaetiibacter intestinalis]AYF98685.1 type II toxin-antitoxin system HipA family toxin [Protaetiibacter intestinalis]
MRLAVELYDTVVGTLDGDARTFDFTASPEGIERFGRGSTALATSIPLVSQQRRDQAGRRRNWFAELLPEGDQYDYLLAQGGIRRGDTPAFLARYGRDVPGALQLWDLDDPSEPRTPELEPLTDAGIRALLEDPIGAPLGNDPAAGKSSLGGVQPKIVLARESRGWARALGGYPTTHILKPQLDGPAGTVIFDEEYGSRLARRLGLASFGTAIEVFDGLAALVIERYDRVGGRRVHQEDFSQALGASGNQKYQRIGGVVSLARVADVLVRHAPETELRRLARMVVLAVGIGNLDLHTKNLGLLHPEDGELLLAPAYDVVPQAHLPNDGELALAVNGVYRHAEVTRDDLLAEFASWGLRRAAPLVNDTLAKLASAVVAEEPLPGAHPQLRRDIRTFTENLQSGRPAGAPAAV